LLRYSCSKIESKNSKTKILSEAFCRFIIEMQYNTCLIALYSLAIAWINARINALFYCSFQAIFFKEKFFCKSNND